MHAAGVSVVGVSDSDPEAFHGAVEHRKEHPSCFSLFLFFLFLSFSLSGYVCHKIEKRHTPSLFSEVLDSQLSLFI